MEIDAGDWDIFSVGEFDENFPDIYVNLRFKLKNNPRQLSLREEDLQLLKKDLEDLGKWRKFKGLKKELGG